MLVYSNKIKVCRLISCGTQIKIEKPTVVFVPVCTTLYLCHQSFNRMAVPKYIYCSFFYEISYNMKKLFLVGSLMCSLSLFGQAQAYEAKIKVKKVEQPAIAMDYSFSEEAVENALKAKMADKRIKGSKSKGFWVYSSAVLDEIAATPLDYSFKTEEKGKKGKETTTLYMVMEGDNAVNMEPAVVSSRAKAFLQNLTGGVEQSDLVLQIKKQEEILVKEEKKLKGLKDDHSSLEKKLKDNESDQEKQQRVIKSQNTILEDLKAKQR